MVLGIAEDYTTGSLVLDAQLRAVPSSGLYLNSGVHPSITIGNLLSFLPFIDVTFAAYDNTASYGVHATTRDRTDIVTKNSKIWECIQANDGDDPQDPEATDSEYWLETNIESLRLKAFIKKVEDRVKQELNLNRRMVNSQYIYEEGEHNATLPEEYSGWAIEPRGSDYITIRVNKMMLTKAGTTPVNVYWVNEGVLKETFTLAPVNGRTVFVDVNKVLTGKGPHYLLVDNAEVLIGDNYMDVLRYNGFLAYPVIGNGAAPETADIIESTRGNGIGLNLTAYFDGSAYLDDNVAEYGSFLRATLEYLAFLTFFHNANNRSNRTEAIQMGDNILMAEVKDKEADTAVSRFYMERKLALRRLDRTLDNAIREGVEQNDEDSLGITTTPL